MVLKVNVACGFHLEALEGVLCLGDGNIVLRHNFSPFGTRAAFTPYFDACSCLRLIYHSVVINNRRLTIKRSTENLW